MLRRLALSLIVLAVAAPSAYLYYVTEQFTATLPAANWTLNGALQSSNGLFTVPGSTGASAISRVSVTDPNNPTVPQSQTAYEIRATLSIKQSGGNYVLYAAASNDALANVSGSYYSLELTNLNLTPAEGRCAAILILRQRSAGAITTFGAVQVPCRDSMEIRMFLSPYHVAGFVDGLMYVYYYFPAAIAGKPGIGGSSMPPTNGFSMVQFGRYDTVPPPSPVSSSSIATLAAPTQINLQWQGALDDPNGPGVYAYGIVRNGRVLGPIRTAEWADVNLTASAEYTYQVFPIDYHDNWGPMSAPITVTTLPLDTKDTRRTGLKPNGAYWGAAGENIDMLSGNLNFTLPILTAKSRAGLALPISLSYNSQMWRKDPTGTFKLGRDVGYGFGWRLQAGSLTPYYSDYWTLNHWVYTDATGAEYALKASGENWVSTEGIYITWQPATRRLYFNDGSFWIMDSTSGGLEEDAGTRYPTLIQDTNGNQILIQYQAGAGLSWPDSSARIHKVFDTRATASSPTYTFSYSSANDPLHLTRIDNNVQTGEFFTFDYQYEITLQSPIAGSTGTFGKTRLLAWFDPEPQKGRYEFTYLPSSSGELSEVKFPYQGRLLWTYRDYTYVSGGQTYREVKDRQIQLLPGEPLTAHWINHPGDQPSASFHSYSSIDDPYNAKSDKVWGFVTDPASPIGGLANYYRETDTSSGYVIKLRKQYTWTTSDNPYISEITTTLDPGTNQIQTKTAQTLDEYGNLLSQQIYDYGNLSTPARSIQYTYLHADPLKGSAYLSRHILNRLLTVRVTGGEAPQSDIVSNGYDEEVLSDAAGIPRHDSLYNTNWTPRGNLTSSLVPSGIKAKSKYDIGGNVVQTSAEKGQTVSGVINFQDWSANQFVVPGKITPGTRTDLETTFQYNAGFQMTNSMAPNAEELSVVYNSGGWPTTQTSVRGAVSATTYQSQSIMQSMNSRFTLTYLDGFGRPWYVEQGASGKPSVVVDVRHAPCACSPLGKVSKVTQPHPFNASEWVWTVTEYDALGRTKVMRQGVTEAIPAGTGTTTYEYFKNTVKVTDPSARYKIFTRDVFGNLTRVAEKNPAAGGADLVTDYTYNFRGQLRTVSMARDATTQNRVFQYDSDGRLVSATHPESGTTALQYNDAGLLWKKTDAKGQVTEHLYDTLNRLIEVKRYNASGTLVPSQGVKYTWDSGTEGNKVGRLWKSEYTAGAYPMEETYFYGAGGVISAKHLLVKNGTQQAFLGAAFNYDNEGRLTQINMPNRRIAENYFTAGLQFNYAFDVLGRPSGMTEGLYGAATDLVKNVTYTPEGYLSGYQVKYNPTQAPGASAWTTTTLAYSAKGQLTRHTVADGATKWMDLEYRFHSTSDDGRVRQQKDWISGEEVTYQYDSLARLIQAETTSAAWGQSYTLDGFGNLTGIAVTKGTGTNLSILVNAANNRISTAGYAYDANGNLTAEPGGKSYYYDTANRMTAGSEGNFGYDPLNHRVYAGNGLPGGDRIHFWGPNGQLLGIYEPHANDAECTEFCLIVNEERVYWQGQWLRTHRPKLGISRLTENDDIFSHTSDRLGTRTSGQYLSLSTNPPARPYGGGMTTNYATYEKPSFSTEMYYAVNRWYSGRLGRFTTPDPYQASGGAADPQSWNRYAYVQGDPVNFYDPPGLQAQSPYPPGYCPAQYSYTECMWYGFTSLGGGNDGGGGGGGGWNPCKVVVGFLPNPLCMGAIVAPPPPPEKISPAKSICTVELWYRPVRLGQNHAYLRISVTFEGTTTWDQVEGGPAIDGFFTHGNLVRRDYSTGLSNPRRTDNHQWGPSRTSAEDPQLCDKIGQIYIGIAYIEDHPVRYRPILGPNSNSYVNYLLQFSGISGWNIAPPDTWAWIVALYQ